MDVSYRVRRTILSVGEIIYDYLTGSEKFGAVAKKLFPIIAEEGATLPYVCYRRTATGQDPVKGHVGGADRCQVTFVCYANTYDDSVDMVETLRELLEDGQWSHTFEDGQTLRVRCSRVVDSDEGYDDDAYAQTLGVEFRIN